jgi:phenylacetic acid degradation operon negative regulatory protein
MNTPVTRPLPAPVAAVLRHFRAQRPLRAGSLLVTVFGDCIAPRGGAVTLGSLIRLGEPFGLTERLVRTAVARLAREGWLAAQRDGRRSEYRLTPGGAERFAQATARIYGAAPQRWTGEWTLLLLPPGERGRELRDALRWLGFGQPGPGLFAHPATTPEQARAWLHGIAPQAQALVLTSTATDAAADRELTARGWDLAELSRAYRRFLKRFGPLEAAVRKPGLSPEAAFLVRTLLIHEYRRIHLQDPLLPLALLPQAWVGAAAYELCRSIYARVFENAEAYLSACAARLHRPLPPAHPSTRARFGGLAP